MEQQEVLTVHAFSVLSLSCWVGGDNTIFFSIIGTSYGAGPLKTYLGERFETYPVQAETGRRSEKKGQNRGRECTQALCFCLASITNEVVHPLHQIVFYSSLQVQF